MTMTRTALFMLPLLTLLGACSHTAAPWTAASLRAPTGKARLAARRPRRNGGQPSTALQLSQLIEQARQGSHDLRAAMARVRQARADLRIAGGPLLPRLDASADAYQQRLLRGQGYSEQDTSSSKRTYRYFNTALTASYELDFWGKNAAARDSARLGLQATALDRDTLELSLTSSVADTYLSALAAREQARIAALNLENAEKILKLVRTRFQAGSSTALELAQQESLVANQQRQLPLYQQEARDAQITLAALLGVPVQALALADQPFDQLSGPSIRRRHPQPVADSPPGHRRRRGAPGGGSADVSVARAALFPTVSLTASLATGDRKAIDLLRNPAFNLGAGLTAPIFNNGALRAERDRAIARQDELLEAYRSVLITSFGEVEKALNNVDGLDRQTRWQNEELAQAQRAFDLAENRYRAGAEDLLSVLEAQRSLFTAQSERVRLREARLQASVALTRHWAAAGQRPTR